MKMQIEFHMLKEGTATHWGCRSCSVTTADHLLRPYRKGRLQPSVSSVSPVHSLHKHWYMSGSSSISDGCLDGNQFSLQNMRSCIKEASYDCQGALWWPTSLEHGQWTATCPVQVQPGTFVAYHSSLSLFRLIDKSIKCPQKTYDFQGAFWYETSNHIA